VPPINRRTRINHGNRERFAAGVTPAMLCDGCDIHGSAVWGDPAVTVASMVRRRPGRTVEYAVDPVRPYRQKSKATAVSVRAHSIAPEMLTHSTSACAPSPFGPYKTAGIPAAAMKAESAQ